MVVFGSRCNKKRSGWNNCLSLSPHRSLPPKDSQGPIFFLIRKSNKQESEEGSLLPGWNSL